MTGYWLEISKKRWGQLSGGKPIVATAHLFENVSLAGLREIWNEFAYGKGHVRRLFLRKEGCFRPKWTD